MGSDALECQLEQAKLKQVESMDIVGVSHSQGGAVSDNRRGYQLRNELINTELNDWRQVGVSCREVDCQVRVSNKSSELP